MSDLSIHHTGNLPWLAEDIRAIVNMAPPDISVAQTDMGSYRITRRYTSQRGFVEAVRFLNKAAPPEMWLEAFADLYHD